METTETVERILKLQAQVKVLNSEIADLKAEAGLAALDLGNYVFGKGLVKVQPNRRWDADKALAFAQEQFPLGEDGSNKDLYNITVTVRQDVAKKYFTAAEYAQCQNNFTNKVEIALL